MLDNMNIVDEIQKILDKNKGFSSVSKLPSLMSSDLKLQLGIKNKMPVSILVKRLESILGESFIFRKKGNSVYILTPCDPVEAVFAELSENKSMTPQKLAALLKPFTITDIKNVVNDLVDSGRAVMKLGEKLEPQIFAVSAKCVRKTADVQNDSDSGEYTQAKFKEAFDELDKGKIFVRVCDLRRALSWPRDVFDNMLRELRDKEIIQMHVGDETLMTQDEIKDCFVNELGDLMGTVTWND